VALKGAVKHNWLLAVVCSLLAVDAALAAKADAGHFDASGWLVVADLSTALVLILAAVCARGPVAQRLLVALVGAAWLLGSWLRAAGSLHQGLLVVALLSFPLGRVRGPWRWMVAVLAVPVALGVDQQIAVSAVFALTALVVLADGRIPPPRVCIPEWQRVRARSRWLSRGRWRMGLRCRTTRPLRHWCGRPSWS